MRLFRMISCALAALLLLASCGGNAGNEASKDNAPHPNDDSSVASNTPASNAPTAGSTGSVTDDFLKTITAETATAKGACGANLTWYYQDNVLVIKGTGDMTDYVETKAPWREDSQLYKQISWVIVDEGVTSVSQAAFANSTVLSKLVFPSTLERIDGVYGFANSTQLREITFLGSAPENVDVNLMNLNSFASSLLDNQELTIYYSHSSFDAYVEQYPDINWVKQ